MQIDKVTLLEKFATFSDYWNPRIVGELNGQQVKIAKFKGAFIWHQHENEDEYFQVIKGEFTMEFRDKTVHVKEGDFLIVPKGVEHKPVAENEAFVLMFEPKSTINTGSIEGELTKKNLEKI